MYATTRSVIFVMMLVTSFLLSGFFASLLNMFYWADDAARFIGYVGAAFVLPIAAVVVVAWSAARFLLREHMLVLWLWLAASGVIGALIPPCVYVVGQQR